MPYSQQTAIKDRVDVHSHFLPPSYRMQCTEHGHEHPDGMPALPEWSIEDHLKMMDFNNISFSYLSISSPGVHLSPSVDDESARKLCRDCNTVAAEAKAQYPTRFGFWASLPLPDVVGSLEEIAHAFDVLHADGISVETNKYGHYLGHESYEPIWAELNRRHAIVFIHPTTGCVRSSQTANISATHTAAPLDAWPNPIFEFFFDTARAVINLFYTGTIARFRNITYIIPHAGGCLPPLIDRFALFGRGIPGTGVHESVTLDFVSERLQNQFYFDMAGTTWPNAVANLLSYVGKDRLLYGSDYPFTSAQTVTLLANIMDSHMEKAFSAEEQEMARIGNARRMITVSQ